MVFLLTHSQIYLATFPIGGRSNGPEADPIFGQNGPYFAQAQSTLAHCERAKCFVNFVHALAHFLSEEFGKNVHTPLKLLTTGQKTPLTFLLTNLLLKPFTTAKLILQLVTR